ncbi:TIGR03668 family PPOX class F420-dependent oxidoreductase [Streptomyces sp. 8N706]|uniref:TIGR03668 family PPOX class F420-dependent oxidoreductase n=1 Tax=Streptomyces sp. 8N706 TaxID=3457416 RepID=UPI003FD0706A
MPDMDPGEARRLFAGARVARLATADGEGRPHLVPVVFAVHGDTVVMAVDHKPKRTTRLKRLANIRANPSVCLLVDRYDEDWSRLWWVRADGEARIGVPPSRPPDAAADPHDALELLRVKYPQYRERPPEGPVVLVTVGRWRGWRSR